MDQRVRNFITAFFSIDMLDQWPELKSSVVNSPPEYREVLRQGLAGILARRPYTVGEWQKLTYADVETADEVYAEVARGYRFLFPGDAGTDSSG